MRQSIHFLVYSCLALLLLTPPAKAFFDPQEGRWINRDPIEEVGGANMYGFGFNNPVSNIDPFGEWVNAEGIIK